MPTLNGAITADAIIGEVLPRMYITADEFRAKKVGQPNRQYSDDQLEDLIAVATANVEAYTERVFSSASYTEKFRGDDSLTHLVYQYPIISITSLAETTIDTTPVTTNYDIANHLVRTTTNDAMGRIEMDGLDPDISAFSSYSLYTVIYTGGYSVIPPAVKHATALWVSELLRADIDLRRENDERAIPLSSEQIAEILNPLRRRRI